MSAAAGTRRLRPTSSPTTSTAKLRFFSAFILLHLTFLNRFFGRKLDEKRLFDLEQGGRRKKLQFCFGGNFDAKKNRGKRVFPLLLSHDKKEKAAETDEGETSFPGRRDCAESTDKLINPCSTRA
jgi:hypothetical protein